MNNINVIGLDLAKNIFQLHGVDATGEVLLRKKLKRSEVLKFFAQIKPCLIGMEACGGSHYWYRELSKFGHNVKMMAPAFVKPYLKSNKNDRNDAEAICEAVQRPTMRFVTPKSPEQQSVLHLHHGRRLLIQQRVALTNFMRSILLEHGITFVRGDKALFRELPKFLEDESQLPLLTCHLLREFKEEYQQLAERIKTLELQLKAWHQQSERSQRLESIPGIGLQTATALAATINDGQDFRNGRQLAAYLGLVPRQASSGGKERLLNISKRGDGYLRHLLIHGARAVVSHVRRRIRAGQPSGNPWVEQLLQRCHVNEVAVALANKIARIAWVVLTRKENFRRVIV